MTYIFKDEDVHHTGVPCVRHRKCRGNYPYDDDDCDATFRTQSGTQWPANDFVAIWHKTKTKQVHSDNDASEVDILGHFGTFWDILGHFGISWDVLRQLYFLTRAFRLE